MDSRAKQRLTGAIILVALFVLLVPELLTGPSATDVPAGTPSDEGMRRYTIDLDATTSSTQPASSQAAQPAVELPPLSPLNEGASRAAPGESAAAAGQPLTRTEIAAAAPGQPAPSAPPPQSQTQTQTQSPTSSPSQSPSQSAAPVAATPVPRADSPRPIGAPAARGSFVVQLGSFGSRDNADRLVRDMTAKGFAAFVAPITSGGRELYRVRVGPTRDRAAAEALAAQLRRAGQSGSIVPIS
jgi:cell division septation protein DedD